MYTLWYAQTHIPAEEKKARAQTRLPAADENPQRTKRAEAPKARRKKTTKHITQQGVTQMLPSPNRLPKQKIIILLRRGMRAGGDAVALVYQRTTGPSRFAFIVSKKIDKRATERNRIRRLLRESIQQVLPQIAACDGVFIARKNIATLAQTDARTLVLDVLRKANLL